MSAIKRSSEGYKGIDKIISYVFCRSVLAIFKYLPVKWAFQFGELLGLVSFYCLKSRREIVEKNLNRVRKWLEKNAIKQSVFCEPNSIIAKKVFKRNFGNVLAALALSKRSKERIKRHIDVDLRSFELATEVIGRKKGAIILFPHMGPWELMSIFTHLFCEEEDANSFNFGAVYRPLNNFYMDRWIRSQRSAHGLKLFSKDDGFLKIVRFLKAPSVLLVSHDQRMREGRQIPFFGEMASTSNLFFSLYKMSKVPILSFSLIKVSDAKGIKWKFKFYEFATSSDQNVDELTFLRHSNTLLERVILDSPLDYFFFQDRH